EFFEEKINGQEIFKIHQIDFYINSFLNVSLGLGSTCFFLSLSSPISIHRFVEFLETKKQQSSINFYFKNRRKKGWIFAKIRFLISDLDSGQYSPIKITN